MRGPFHPRIAGAFAPQTAACSLEDATQTRRAAIAFGLRAAGALGLSSLGLKACAPGGAVSPAPAAADGAFAGPPPLDRAYAFLERMMDLYAGGSTPRVVQSFVPTKAIDLGDTAYTYDNAVVVAALLARGSGGDLARARLLGESLIYAQLHDPAGDGRIRDAYGADGFVTSGGGVKIAPGNAGSDTGNVAWAGLALCLLYAKTRWQPALKAALAAGTWLYEHAHDTRGAGGYTGGLQDDMKYATWKSTENNVDVYAFFTMLHRFTSDAVWESRAGSALALVDAMWDATSGHFWVGTGYDGVSINRVPIPEDCQSWTYLATKDAARAASLGWAERRLGAAGGYGGVSFSNADRSGTWFEGTAHMAAALLARNAPGDAATAASYLQSIERAQASAPNHDGYGIVAASKNGLRTGDGDAYFAALHIGATGWYCIAAAHGNPFVAG
jgi:hypothetical protein